MKLQDLLRHIADNVENGKKWGCGLSCPTHFKSLGEVCENSHRVELAPRTHVVNGFTVPAPEVQTLTKNDSYYMPDASIRVWFVEYAWFKDSSDKRFLERGLVHLTKEAAIANAKAMLGIDPYSEGEK